MSRSASSRETACFGPLVLVNAGHPLHPDSPPLLTPALPGFPDILLERQAAAALEACVRAVGGQDEIVPVSGWRSRSEQQQIWDSSLAEKGDAFTRQYVALPGCSEHQTGLAIDLGKKAPEIDFICPDFPRGRDLRCLSPGRTPLWIHSALSGGKGGVHRNRSRTLAFSLCGRSPRPADDTIWPVSGRISSLPP